MIRRAALALLCASPAAAQFPEGYVVETVVNGLSGAVGFVHDANGRMYILERRGVVRILEDGELLSPPLLDIHNEVGRWHDFGMLGLVLDPDFLENGHFYVSYVVDRHHLLYFGTSDYGPGMNEYQDATIGRITRYTADPATGFRTVVPDSRRVLVGETKETGVPILHLSHGTGGLAFGSDGTLLATMGDGASFNVVDTGSSGDTYWEQALADNIIRPAENVGGFRSQLLNSHSGKLLRIDPETGDGLPSNPFYDPAAPRSARSRTWALGLRNPFRMSVRPGTGQTDPAAGDPGVVYIGDVGWSRFEELHIVSEPGMNLGWPIFEGLTKEDGYANAITLNLDAPNPLYDGVTCTQEFYSFQDLLKQEREDHSPNFTNPCDESVAISPSAPTFMHRRAHIEWRHSPPPVANVPIFNEAGLARKVRLGEEDCPVDGEPFNGSCAVGGVWLSGLGFGEPYNGAYFVADYVSGWIRALKFEHGEVLHEVLPFGQTATPVFLGEDPNDGSLLFVRWGTLQTGAIRRVRFTGDGNVAPQAVAHVGQAGDPSPSSSQAVRLDATSSEDPEGGALAFLWEFEDGTSSTVPSPLITFENPSGAPTHHEVELSVTDASGATSSTHVHVHLDNTPPAVTLNGAANGAVYSTAVETAFDLEAVAFDEEHVNEELDFVWEAFLLHATHEHPVTELTGPAVQIVLPPTPCNQEFYGYRVVATVTDPEGLATSETLWFFPDCPGSGSAAVTSPGPGDSLHAGETLTVDVDTTGAVTRVDLYANGELASSSFAPPFSFSHTPLEAGTLVLAALAHVDGEGIATSPGVPVEVLDPKLAAHDVTHVLDDAQELFGGAVKTKRPVLELGQAQVNVAAVAQGAGGSAGSPSLVGIRVPLDVPNGATIHSAHLQLSAHGADTGGALLNIRVESSDDAAPISASNGALSSRVSTGDTASWNALPWRYPNARGWRQRTPDLTALLQTIVDRPGWESGNHVLLLVDGLGRRRAWAYTQDGTEAPRLVVRYTD